ncbi:cupin domain-containing protein [Ectothiorhodospiraceae bacterium BW-2]|nr:cupin domain-containing protein [Ectothiorhodospiraceae bacterium BW-2]
MIIRSLSDIENTERDVAWGNGQSRRFLIAEDNMGFTLTETTVLAGTESLIQYRHHLEACYCIEGQGEIEVEGEVFPLKPGTMYAPNAHDVHYLRATKTLRLVCVFLPALQGSETHQFHSGKDTKGSSY